MKDSCNLGWTTWRLSFDWARGSENPERFYFSLVRSRTELTQLTFHLIHFQARLFISLYFSCLVGRISGGHASFQESAGPLDHTRRERTGVKDRQTQAGVGPLLGGARSKPSNPSHFSAFVTATNEADILFDYIKCWVSHAVNSCDL